MGITVVTIVCFVTGILLITRCENPSQPVPPQLVLTTTKDTTVRAGDNFSLGVDVANGSYWGMHFIWCVDNTVDTSKEYKRTFSWQFSDTGTHMIIVSALDQRMVAAQPETLNVRVKCSYPTIDAHQNDTTIFWGDTLRISPVAYNADGSVKNIRWKTDLDTLWYTTIPAARSFSWGRFQTGHHYIFVRAVDDLNLLSMIDTVNVYVNQPASKIEIIGNDTTLQLMSPAAVHARINGTAPGHFFYRWLVDSTVASLGNGDSVKVLFGKGQTGKHRIIAQALCIDSSVWSSDTLFITTRYDRVKPSIFLKDSTVYINDVVRCVPMFNCQLSDVDSIWYTIDTRVLKKTAVIDTFKVNFQLSDSGSHLIQLHAIDTDGIPSESEIVKVTVVSGYPEVYFPDDTTISVNDTLRIAAKVKDVNGSIVSSELLNDGIRIDTNLFNVFYKGKYAVVLKAAVTDDDSLRAYDSMEVHFNASPVVNIHGPLADTLYCTESNPVVSAPMYYSTFDKDNDPVTIDLEITKKGKDTLYTFKGAKDSVLINVNGPGIYYWKMKVRDSFGSFITINDSFTVVMNHTICFVGHSIVSGMMGDGQNGGFRATVLKGLRENLIEYHSVKATGPLTTPDMALYPKDDSCFAISGSKAYEMYFFLRSGYKSLTADMWVIMLGANSQYSTLELRSTIQLLDIILTRCPQSKVYILTSPPFPDIDEFSNGNWYRPYYNQGIYDSVAVRNKNGSHISVVDADTLMTDSLMQFDSTWFSDHVHPNMKGYVRMGEKILSVMRSKENPAMNPDLYRKNE
jgi:hypothetical protein